MVWQNMEFFNASNVIYMAEENNQARADLDVKSIFTHESSRTKIKNTC